MTGILSLQGRSSYSRVGLAAAVLVAFALAAFYVLAATEHARRMNTSKARADQSGYLWDAQNVYANWHGRQPPTVIGERNRMPLYAGFLALFYHPGLSDPDYFIVAQQANIYLSLVLLAGLATVFRRELPAHAALNLTGILAFGYFIYKAGYAQSELLYYFLHFLAFLGCWHLLGRADGSRTVALAAAAGAVAALAHLTKAATLPFVAVFLAVYCARGGAAIIAADRDRARIAGWTAATAGALVTSFLLVLWPYLSTSKRVFGHYFYNVNSTFYVWYDNWALASLGTFSHGDGVGWPTLPDDQLPSASRYWRENSFPEIAARIGSGFEDMAIVSYRTFGYLPYVVAFGLMFALLLCTRRAAMRAVLSRHRWRLRFALVYAVILLLAIAFYFPTSGTGTGRFLLAHLAPAFFACSCLFSAERLRKESWSAGGLTLTVGRFNTIVTAMLTIDVLFRVWPRLMSTYGGF